PDHCINEGRHNLPGMPRMFNIVLYQPEIPPNTGNIMRLASNARCRLHLVGPLGSNLEEKNLRRAHLDYRDLATVTEYGDWQHFMSSCRPGRLLALSTKGRTLYSDAAFEAGDYLLFGPESRGLPETLLQGPDIHMLLTLPMVPGSRSLNLSSAVAVTVYEAWRQQGTKGRVS